MLSIIYLFISQLKITPILVKICNIPGNSDMDCRKHSRYFPVYILPGLAQMKPDHQKHLQVTAIVTAASDVFSEAEKPEMGCKEREKGNVSQVRYRVIGHRYDDHIDLL